MLLVLFLLAVQLGPAFHLASHRDDHTHGLETTARAHASAHRAGLVHDHDDEKQAGNRSSRPDPPLEEGPGHGQWTSAHFGLALLAAPPPPALPAPAERLAPRVSPVLRAPLPPDDHAPPVRGPPRDTSC